jgi:chaperonin GroES
VYPTEFKILVEPKKVEEKTKGGIIIPDESKDREQFAQMEGVLVAVSPLAFTYADWKDANPPKPGDRVLFAKFAGAKVTGKDGKEYRLVNDKDLAAVLE